MASPKRLGLDPGATGLVGWDVFDAVLTPGEAILLMSWRDRAAAEAFAHNIALPAARGCARFAWSATTACSTAARRRNIIRTRRVLRLSTPELSF